MKNKFLLAFGAFLLLLRPASGQMLTDTLLLKEVSVMGMPKSFYAVGLHRLSLDSAAKALVAPAASVGMLLQQFSPLYLRSYGEGALTTIAFRGTGSGHTAVMWNGINIGLPTVGMTDFALLPAFAVEQVEVHFGGGSALWGSDAVGGTILLQNQHFWERPDLPRTELALTQGAGSFGRFFTGAQAAHRWNRLEIRTRLYHSQADNNFLFVNTTLPGRPVQRMPQSRTVQRGFLQEVNWQLSDWSTLSIKGWYHFNDRDLQPVITALNERNEQQDENVRMAAEWRTAPGGRRGKSLGIFTLRNAWVRDMFRYNQQEPATTNRLHSQLEYEKRLLKSWTIQAGASHLFTRAGVEQYRQPRTEHRQDFYLLSRYHLSQYLRMVANLRQSFVTGYQVPFTPSVGVEWDVPAFSALTAHMQWSRNFRAPSLNDRFWQPGGRPNLLPEKGQGGEAGLAWKGVPTALMNSFRLSVWLQDVSNWILWTPGATFWSPENIQRVRSRGVELTTGGSWKGGKLSGEWRADGTFSRSTSMVAVGPSDRSVGKQLAYTPEWTAGARHTLSLSGWALTLAADATGRRFFTSDETGALPAFYLIDARIDKKVRKGRNEWIIGAELTNIANHQYQHLRFRPMPGRAFNVQLSWKWRSE